MTSQYFQHTLAQTAIFVGRGLHSGESVRMVVQPADADTGILFVRTDVSPKQAEISARWHNVTDTRLNTKITNRHGVGVATIEHLMAALYVAGIDNARIQLNGPEVPIMDGSAEPFLRMFRKVGTRQQLAERRAIVVRQPVRVEETGRSASFLPAPIPWIDMAIDFEHTSIGHQALSIPLERELLSDDIMAARTFGFQDQIETLRKLGLAKGGSLQNAVLVGDEGVINVEGLRYSDEFVRHKVLDAVGDLALSGYTIFGRFVGMCSGHGLNNQLLRCLLQNEQAWTFTTLSAAEQYWTWTQSSLPPLDSTVLHAV